MNKYLAVVVANALVAACAHAAVIATETWDTPGAPDNWTLSAEVDTGPVATSAQPGGFGNPASAFEVTETVPGSFGPDIDRIGTTSGGTPANGFNGDYSNQSIGFDFYMNALAQGLGFNSLQLYFVGGVTTWQYGIDVSGQAGDSWASYNVRFADSTGWTEIGPPTVNGFDVDKTTVTEIGFRITYLDDSGATAQQYGFDNVSRGYAAPEPSTYAAIGFGLVSLAVAFRKRLTELLATVRVTSAA